MATRSAIAYATPKGYRAVYCHWDGYPSHHMPILQQHYGTADAVRDLIRPGDISCLRTRNTWQTGATLRDPSGEVLTDSEGNWRSVDDRDAQPLYFKERGETDIASRFFRSLQTLAAWADGCGCEHVYVFTGDQWQHSLIGCGPDGSASVAPGCDPAQY
jgi:hypothetical protein